MITVNRDYGSLDDNYPNNTFTTTPKRQVYQATHRGDDSRLPYMNRSFISFRFGGKQIEDFDLLATINNNSLERAGYAEFEDNTTSYNNLDGQQYWSTHHKANKISFTLSTDGIDQQKLEDFLHWFRAGDTKELILAEHPNRAILARVAQPPQLQLLPFESEVEVMISSYSYTAKTTLYKGSISLDFTMDQPFWYAKDNLLGIRDEDNHRYIDQWIDANGNQVSIFASQDALKILYEDGIPLGSMVQKNMLLGNGAYASVEGQISSKIWDPNYTGEAVPNSKNLAGGGACINGKVGNTTYHGIIAGAIIDINGNGIETLSANTNAYFYYSGTAPSPTIISFTMTPAFNNNYISSPFNSTTTPKYNTITIESEHIQKLYFTTPNLLTSYNKAIDIFKKQTASSTKEELCERIREDVRHASVRAWAITIINNNTKNADTYCSRLQSTFSESVSSMTFTFNSENGEAIGEFKNQNNVVTFKEDVGDMLNSNYIILRDRNHPTADGYITEWHENDKLLSHRIYHNIPGGISNLQILYKNMYL